MSAFIDAVRSAGRRVLWLDATDYTARLLMRDTAPWRDAAGYVAWQRQAQALLNSDVVGVPLARLAEAWVATDAALTLAMRAKRRNTYPLQRLLGDTDLREHLSSLVRDLRTTFDGRVLALTLPTPRRLLGVAHALAHGAESAPLVEDDDVEIAAMHVADFLRAFGSECVQIVLIEAPPASPIVLDDASYEPLINLAKYYRWDIGVRAGAVEPGGGNAGIDFAVTPTPPTHLTHGVEVDQRFWSGAAMPVISHGSFLFAQIPPDAAPEQVLERLALLRAA